MNRFELAHELHQLARLPGAGPALATQAQQGTMIKAIGRKRLQAIRAALGIPQKPLPLHTKAEAWRIINYYNTQGAGVGNG